MSRYPILAASLLVCCGVFGQPANAQSLISNSQITEQYSPRSVRSATKRKQQVAVAAIDQRFPVQLELSSRDAFQNAQLPVSDYVFYLGLARDAHLVNAGDDRSELLAVWEAYLAKLRHASQQLRAMQSVGGVRAKSERSLADFSAMRTERKIAILNNDLARAAALDRASSSFASVHYRHCQADYDMGLLDAATLLSASLKTNPNTQHSQDRSSRPNSLGSHQQLSYEVGLLEQHIASGDSKAIDLQVGHVDRLCHDQFRKELSGVHTNTGTLSALTRTVAIRQRLQPLRVSLTPGYQSENDPALHRLHNDWKILADTASRNDDRTKRFAADRAAIALVGQSLPR